MKSRYLLFLLTFFYLMPASITATEKYKFRTMSPEGGFYYDGVKAIEQDKEGFIWIMMDYELYRFDGYHYKKYYPYFASMAPTQRWIFNNMASDSCGRLYVNTNNGLYCYERISDRFEKIYDAVSHVKVDKMDNLWIRYNNKWNILDTSKGELNVPCYDGKMPTYNNTAFCIYNKDLYTFIHRKVYRFNYVENKFVLCLTLPNVGNGYIRFAQAYMGKLWLFIDKEGLYKIDLSTFNIEDHYEPLPEYNSNSLRAFYIDKKGMIWLGTIDGLYILDPSNRKLTQYKHSGTDPFSLPHNSIWEISEDRQSNVWIGTYSGTLCYVNIDENGAFKTYHTQNSGLSYAPVSSFAEEQDYLWIGTEGGGINRMNKATGEFSSFTHKNNVAFNNVKSLIIDADDNLWISTFREGMDLYNSARHKVVNYKHSKSDSTSLLVNDVRKTILEGDSGMWVAYQYPMPEVSYFSYRSKSFTHFSLDSTRNYAYLFDILRQGESTLWAISNEALYRMDTHTCAVEKIVPNDSTYLGLFTFCLDDSGNIWIGTIGNGLIKFDTNTYSFTSLKEGLQQNIYSIYSICYDDGNVWMGTDEGLFCYDIARNYLMNFDKRENTQGQVYYPLASMKGRDGLLYFGGTNGFTIIDPKKISLNNYKPKAIISDFFIDHESVHPNYVLNDSLNTVMLDYEQVNFGFQFSSDNYHIPEKNRFKFRLKGYNDSWITANAQQRMVMYSKVPAGTYYFEVYAANNDGVWSDKPTVIKIIRKTAPWLSLPAYFLYVLTVLGVACLIYRHYAEKKKLKMLLYQENIEKDKKEQIHQAQLRFFTNISHDFRTPLSLILAALDKLRREGLKEYYYRILNGNVQRLLNLVNELMDFRTIENGMMHLELQPLNINHFVKEIASDFIDYAGQRDIDFQIKCDETLSADIYVDKNIIEKIVMNLLNNAFKYTRDKGRIVLEIRRGKDFVSRYKNSYTVGESMNDVFSIIVSDTGVGISQESISSVFERFYKVNTVNADSHLGTGIGLALVKSLVLLQKGNISIFSEREMGTDMIVCLPLDSNIFDDTDFMNQKETVQEATVQPKGENVLPTDIKDIEDGLSLSNKKKILVVEDNEDLRMLIAESLSEEFQVMQACDGVAALKLIEDVDFDLIISDIMMPNKDGVSLCNDIKNDMNTSHIPVILLTAKTSLESKIEGVDSGADLYFEKPVDLTYLKLSIQNIFRNQQQLKEHYAKNYYADSNELSSNEQDSKFLKQFIAFIEANMDQSQMDVNLIAEELSMSRSKLYTKVKSLTGKSVVEFVLNCRLRKAAKLIIEENMTMREVMMEIGIESQAYFTNSFKKVFGETPTSFAAKHKK
ncbi:hybrid sensor histidine kinase/response regulator transcription factor [Bacteroides oleiciplenus]|uniref:histidine kinase n=1 Tax=Bacteroides oleiciplenus TaxID=626931 RepID=A0A3E5BRP0_9BACE|nr:hybrid sensor histidine kinase/response regulator transcription factor [Bacteroides oleiciplenus]RGN40300.1 hybrid sensor histidine kinase/response regulator [Bacteroides oleiciplenus]